MKLITVPAIVSFTHDGERVAAGTLLTLPPVKALIYKRKGYVSLSKGYRTRELVPEPVIEPEPEPEPETPRRRRRYRRRDLTAETPTDTAA